MLSGGRTVRYEWIARFRLMSLALQRTLYIRNFNGKVIKKNWFHNVFFQFQSLCVLQRIPWNIRNKKFFQRNTKTKQFDICYQKGRNYFFTWKMNVERMGFSVDNIKNSYKKYYLFVLLMMFNQHSNSLPIFKRAISWIHNGKQRAQHITFKWQWMFLLVFRLFNQCAWISILFFASRFLI